MSDKRILIAEDEQMLGDMLHFELSSRGPSVTLARNGEEAIALLEREQPDLLLLDLLMPKASGYDVLQYLQGKGHRFPVVILSNLSDPQEQKRCLELGANEFLVKSQMEPDDLWNRIERYLIPQI